MPAAPGRKSGARPAAAGTTPELIARGSAATRRAAVVRLDMARPLPAMPPTRVRTAARVSEGARARPLRVTPIEPRTRAPDQGLESEAPDHLDGGHGHLPAPLLKKEGWQPSVPGGEGCVPARLRPGRS